jgi:hypothetical protein
MAFHGNCVVANRFCRMVASSSCQRGGVALLDLIAFTIIAGICGGEQGLQHSIKCIVPPEFKVRVALMGA